MDLSPDTTKVLIEASAELAKLAVKGTVSVITSKIRGMKEEKDVEKIRSFYDGVVNELIQEREEAVRIAQVYKSEIERIKISDEDIEHLHNTVERVLEILQAMSIMPDAESRFESIKELINIDTLKTMQLLGFNYKAAIGEPLTSLCANAITSIGNKQKQSINNVTASIGNKKK